MNQSQILALVDQTMAACTKFFKEQQWVEPSWKAVVRTSFSLGRNRSWGGSRRGVPFISLSLKRYAGVMGGTFEEYRSFARDPEIGTVAGNTEHAIRALVIHEMCHAALGTRSAGAAVATRIGVSYNGGTIAHGPVWQKVYRITRNALLNKELGPRFAAPMVNSLGVVVVRPRMEPVAPVVRQQNSIQRGEALRLIRDWKFGRGWTNARCISELVVSYGFKKTTATTYTYSV